MYGKNKMQKGGSVFEGMMDASSRIFTPTGAALAAATKIAKETPKKPKKPKKDQELRSIVRQTKADSTENVSSKMKNTVRDIQGTPAEIAADKKRAEATKASAEVSKPKPNTKASSEDSTENIEEFLRIKKSKGGKVSMGRGMGKALRGGGKVMR